MAERTEHEVWRRRSVNGLPFDETHREVGGHRVSGAVAPDFDWRADGVLWGVTFHRYTPRNPTIRRANGKMPPPLLPEVKIGGRLRPVPTDSGQPDALVLEDLMREGRIRCEQALASGRPAPPEQPQVQDAVQTNA